MEPEEGAQRSPEAEVVDATGLKCPEPVMMLHNAIRKAQPGGHVLLQATDPSTQRDVPQFCKFLEHQLLDSSADEAAGRYSYLIEKQPS
ncbi:MAG: sulfurtransferase TusA [Luminiphilus sp.]|nr:sulfurtransferase TusA [Luminiphilus sp.]MDG1827625.1 sulfurtransferase TusA [Luminiphilus sp.]MDG2137005.1 sulfurtransferase TusA [Luminiphilus sp.]MDG2493749.1 sulfurtransferase TusA [Luminiphilus sp.]